MTAPKTAENVCRGTPSQSAQVPYSRDSSTIVSPTSKNTAVITRSILHVTSTIRAPHGPTRSIRRWTRRTLPPRDGTDVGRYVATARAEIDRGGTDPGRHDNPAIGAAPTLRGRMDVTGAAPRVPDH